MIFYTVYRTQNLVNGKYYFGVHKTKDPYDGYLGSGKILKAAMMKYGESSFIKNVCFIFDNAEKAFAKEFELIETYRVDPLCYNLRQGGSGGFDWINQEGFNGTYFVTKESVLKREATRRRQFETNVESRRTRLEHINRIRLLIDPVKRESRRQLAVDTWRGHKHTEETKKKFSQRVGKSNSQFGTRWVNRNGVVKKVRSDEVENHLCDGWRRGRK